MTRLPFSEIQSARRCDEKQNKRASLREWGDVYPSLLAKYFEGCRHLRPHSLLANGFEFCADSVIPATAPSNCFAA